MAFGFTNCTRPNKVIRAIFIIHKHLSLCNSTRWLVYGPSFFFLDSVRLVDGRHFSLVVGSRLVFEIEERRWSVILACFFAAVGVCGHRHHRFRFLGAVPSYKIFKQIPEVGPCGELNAWTARLRKKNTEKHTIYSWAALSASSHNKAKHLVLPGKRIVWIQRRRKETDKATERYRSNFRPTFVFAVRRSADNHSSLRPSRYHRTGELR